MQKIELILTKKNRKWSLMMFNPTVAYLFLTLFFLVNAMAFSQENKSDPSFKISYIGIEKGLSNNAVTSIYQDSRGFIWAGTYDGLNRYDGYNFLVYRNQPDDSTTLINNRIVSIYENRMGVWVGTKNGLSVYDYITGKFQNRYHIDHNSGKPAKIVYTINQISGHNHNTYIATAGKGLLFQSDENKMAEQLLLLSKDGEQIWDFHAQGLDFDPKGRMWVFVQGHGLTMYNQSTGQLEIVSTMTKSANCLTIDGQSNIWVGMDHGLLRYSPNSQKHDIYPQDIIRNKITNLLYIKEENQIWAASDGNGVMIYDINQESFSHLREGTSPTDMTSNSVYAICRDNIGNKWLGTLRGGINVVENESQLFRTVSKNSQTENSLASNFILSFCEYGENKLWIGTDGNGLSLWDRKSNDFINFSHSPNDPNSLSNNYVTSILCSGEDFWFGTYGGGISRFNHNNRKFERFTLLNTKNNSLQNNIWVLYKDTDNRIWAATSDGEGLYRYDKEKDSFLYVDAGINGIISLAEDKDGELWAGTFNNLVKLDLNSFNHQRYEINYPVRSIIFGENNTLLLGTEGGGLLEFSPQNGITNTYTEKNGLPNNSVLNILKDDQGLYWLSTYNGLAKFDNKSKKFLSFFDSDGLQSNQFNYNAALKLKNGELLMGGIKGFNIIQPEIESSCIGYPKLLITGIKVNNIPVENLEKNGLTAFAQKHLELSYDQSMLTVDFAALEFSLPDKISYSYYLEGWDRTWNEVGHARTANYSKLKEGNYRLRIKSTNSDGSWNEQEAAITITILAPWYRTAWAYTIYILLASGFIYGIFWYQKEKTRLKYEVWLSREKAVKEKELNEKKLSFFTNISHEFRSPLTMIINPLKEVLYGQKTEIDQGEIEVVYRNSKRLLNLVDQLLLFRKTESETGELKLVKVDLVSLGKEVFTCFIHHAKSRNIQYKFLTQAKECLVYGDRQKIEIALFNLISNALKFTEKNKGEVKVSLSPNEDSVYFAVSDNGKGISDKEINKIYELFYQSGNTKNTGIQGFGIGLYLVKKFMDQHFGEIKYTKSEMGGSTFTLLFKKGKEHFQDFLIHEDFGEHAVFPEELLDEQDDATFMKAGESVESFMENLVDKGHTIMIVDDNFQIRQYVKKILSPSYKVVEASNAEQGLGLLNEILPDLIISDVIMGEMNGVEFCKALKNNENLKHIPIILLTGTRSDEIKLKGVEVGADDYITKPFDKEYLIARVKGILKSQKSIQDHLLNTVTLKNSNLNISEEDKELLEKLSSLIESHLEDEGFNIKILSIEMAMSHSLLYRKTKLITGKSINELIRFIRLRKAATQLITTDMQINEAAFSAGFSDLKYFRKQFNQLYGMNPSEFQKKYQNALTDKQYLLNEKLWKFT